MRCRYGCGTLLYEKRTWTTVNHRSVWAHVDGDLAVKNLARSGDRREQRMGRQQHAHKQARYPYIREIDGKNGRRGRPLCLPGNNHNCLVLARSPDLARVLTEGLHPSDNPDRACDLTIMSPGSPLRRCGRSKTFVIGGLRAIYVLPTQNPWCPQSRPTSLHPGYLRTKGVVGADPCVCPETIIIVYTSPPFQNPLGGVLLRGLRTPPPSMFKRRLGIGGVDKGSPLRPTRISGHNRACGPRLVHVSSY